MVTKRGKETPEVSTGNDHLDINDNRVNTENSTTIVLSLCVLYVKYINYFDE